MSRAHIEKKTKRKEKKTNGEQINQSQTAKILLVTRADDVDSRKKTVSTSKGDIVYMRMCELDAQERERERVCV
jgi:hypothetical protein